MNDEGQTQSAAPCSTCGSIPDELMVNTGRGDYFPSEVDQLTKLDLGRSNDLRRCPTCGSLFEWIDLPQYYGSGNNDEEQLVRLKQAQTTPARLLLDTGGNDSQTLPGFDDLFRVFSRDLACTLLSHVALRRKAVFAPYIGSLVAGLISKNDSTFSDLLGKYCGTDRGRLLDVTAFLDSSSQPLGPGAKYLRQIFQERLAQSEPPQGAAR